VHIFHLQSLLIQRSQLSIPLIGQRQPAHSNSRAMDGLVAVPSPTRRCGYAYIFIAFNSSDDLRSYICSPSILIPLPENCLQPDLEVRTISEVAICNVGRSREASKCRTERRAQFEDDHQLHRGAVDHLRTRLVKWKLYVDAGTSCSSFRPLVIGAASD
jgi:hypothetical protein